MAVHPIAAVLAVLFMVAPLVLAIFIDRQTASFQREAFGHLANAARNLRIMSWMVFAYYLLVLFGSLWVGDLDAMFMLPMPKEGIQIYMRIGAAILAYVGALGVARELFLVTKPRPNA